MNFILLPYSPENHEFLYQLYASTRMQEFALLGWTPAQLDVFLRMQFNAQQRWYEEAYQGAEHRIIFQDDKPIGRILVHHQPEAALLVDIALLPEHRNHGIGAKLISELIAQSEKAGVPVRLQVLKTNPAQHLYVRLGFVKTGEDQMYIQMERRIG